MTGSSQEWADVLAMAMSLKDDPHSGRYIEIMRDYMDSNSMGEPVIPLRLVSVMMTLLAQLLDATADYLEMDVDELGNFLLMEKFKRDLFDG